MNVRLITETKINKEYLREIGLDTPMIDLEKIPQESFDKLREYIEHNQFTMATFQAEELHREYNISPEQLIIYIARVSSSRKDKFQDYQKLISYLLEHKHWSPFEHVFFGFEVVTSRYIGRQLLRHRSQFFQEFSQRYAKVTNFEPLQLFKKPKDGNRQSSSDLICEVITPEEISTDQFRDALAILKHYATDCEFKLRGDFDFSEFTKALLIVEKGGYLTLIDNGVSKESARGILPETTQTTMYISGSLRSFIHFVMLRDDPENVQKGAVEIAQQIKQLLSQKVPTIAKSLNWIQ